MVDFMGSVDAVANVDPPSVVVPATGFFGTLALIAGFVALLIVLAARGRRITPRQAPSPGR